MNTRDLEILPRQASFPRARYPRGRARAREALPPVGEAVVLVLAAYRVSRLVGWDRITEDARVRLTGDPEGTRRPRLAEFLHCAFCTSVWSCAALYASWRVRPAATLAAAAPLAGSAVVGLVATKLDP
jgi:hypothetical protein